MQTTTKTKTTVIYHSADFDGIFCHQIARRFLGNEGVDYIGWDHGDPKIEFPSEGTVYVLDLNPDCFVGDRDILNEKWGRLVWIDHHKSAIDSWPAEFPGYRIDGVSACRLAWQWFIYKTQRGAGLPDKQMFVDREVSEPLAVRLAGEYDIWDKRDERAEVFQFGLRSRNLTAPYWDSLLDTDHCGASHPLLDGMLNDGRLLQSYQQQSDANMVKARSFRTEFEGLKFIVLNTARCNSLTFAALDVPESGHDALMGFFFNGTVCKFSLYAAKHRLDLDLSVIAKKYGGGGHRQACGFELAPWKPCFTDGQLHILEAD